MRSLVLLTAAAAMLVGCMGSSEQRPIVHQPQQQSPPAMLAVVANGSFFEPTIAATPTGVVLVANANGGLWRSTDAGATFAKVPDPPLGKGAPLAPRFGDIVVQADAQGRVWWSALVGGALSQAVAGIAGLDVARSDDGGLTWPVSVFISPAQGGIPDAQADRQWVATSGAEAWLAFTTGANDEIVYASQDAGATWSGGSSANTLGLHAGPGGRAIATSLGLILPYFDNEAADASGPVFLRVDAARPQSAALPALVADVTSNPVLCCRFALAASDGDQNAYVGWEAADGDAYVAASHDAGATWQPPTRAYGNATSHPAILASPKAAWAVGFTTKGLVAARLGGDSTLVANDAKASGYTDFPDAALLPDGRIAAPLTDGKTLWIATAALP